MIAGTPGARFMAGRWSPRYTLHMPDSFTYDLERPLDRSLYETRVANDALHDYYRQGAGRSIRSLLSEYRKQTGDNPGTNLPPTRRFNTLANWSTVYRWQERIDLQTRLDQEAERAAREAAMEAEVKKWAERRISVRERDWQQAERLRILADQILDESPKFLKTTRRIVHSDDGGPDREIITVGIDAKLMTAAMVAASKLQRLAAEMETEHTLDEVTRPEDIEEVRRKRWLSIQEELAEAIGIDSLPEPAMPPDGGAHE